MVASIGQTNSLWLRPLNATSAHKLDQTEGASFPFWSPDGRFLAFFTEDKLKRIDLAGGAIHTICDLGSSTSNQRGVNGNGGAWSKDGVILFARFNGPLMRVPAQGGIASPATSLDKGENVHIWPQFLPDGRHFLYLARGRDPASQAVWVQELGSPQRVLVQKNGSRAVWTPQGFLLFTRDEDLFAQRINARTFHLEGEPVAVAEGVLTNLNIGRSTFAVSDNGLLVYRTGVLQRDSQLTWRDRGGKMVGQPGKPGPIDSLDLSPDGKRVALLMGPQAAADLWIMEVADGVIAPLTHDARIRTSFPITWSRDSKRILISGLSGIQAISADSGQIDSFTSQPLVGEDWMPDGNSIECSTSDGKQRFLLPLSAGATPQPLFTTPYSVTNVRISPDGKYVVYQSTEMGPTEIFVASFPSLSQKRRISTNGGATPLWTKGGKEVVYAQSADLVGVEIRTGGGGIEIGERKTLFSTVGTQGSRFGVSADGQRFLLREVQAQATPEVPQLTIMLNWFAEIGRSERAGKE
jgi:Tol biopolymer transport system component